MVGKARNGNRQKTSVEGTMDITEHLKTWNGFLTGVKWSVVGIIVILVVLAVFRTNQ
jgi:basic membrane lipoprotein Med (substrate-binding protein (PBP1-ABC) superfamily)